MAVSNPGGGYPSPAPPAVSGTAASATDKKPSGLRRRKIQGGRSGLREGSGLFGVASGPGGIELGQGFQGEAGTEALKVGARLAEIAMADLRVAFAQFVQPVKGIPEDVVEFVQGGHGETPGWTETDLYPKDGPRAPPLQAASRH